jgi:hypothetical protein
VSVGTRPVDRSSAAGVIRAAVVQAAPVAFDRERTLDRVEQLTAESAANGVQLVVADDFLLALQGATRRNRSEKEGRR